MKIGIIGAGTVGTSLGKALIKVGHEIQFSSREPHSAHAQQIGQETGATVGSVAEVLAYGEILVLALAPDAALDVARAHQGQWVGKTLIDLNNRFGGTGRSFAQELAEITGAKVIKAFNTIGAEHYQNPIFEGEKATMFIAGDDPAAKEIVLHLATQMGFEAIDVGGLNAAEMLENLAKLWVHLVRSGLGRNIAFKLIRR